MRLLLFIYSLDGGGAERVTTMLAKRWLDEGDQVTLVTLSDERDFFRLDPRVRRIALAAASSSGNVFAAMLANGRRLIALRTVLKHERPDIAIAMMTTASVLLAIASAGLAVVTIGSERAHPARAPIGRVWSWLRQRAYWRLGAVVAQTPEAAQWLRSHTSARRVAVIPNSVVWPLPEQAPRVSPSIVGAAGRSRLLAVGRLHWVKGYELLLEAFAELATRFADWELVIVGEGTQRAGLQERVVALGLTGRAYLVGRVGNLAEWYSSAKLLVLTSRHEGFPNVLLEALACGVPVVSFDCEAGPRNIVRPDVDGLLVPDQDLAALVAALGRLMSDAEFRAACAANAPDVRQRFAEERVAGLWRSLFEQLHREQRRD